jgi:hypothetical protein
VVDDGVSGVLFLTDCTCSWEVRDVVLFTVLDLSVWAGAMLADLERLSSTVVGICFSVIFMLFGVVAPMVTGPLLSLSVFLTDWSCSELVEILDSIAEAMVGDIRLDGSETVRIDKALFIKIKVWKISLLFFFFCYPGLVCIAVSISHLWYFEAIASKATSTLTLVLGYPTVMEMEGVCWEFYCLVSRSTGVFSLEKKKKLFLS